MAGRAHRRATARARRALALVLATLLVVPVAAHAGPELRSPVYGTGVRENGMGNFPDPSLLRAEGRWFAFATGSSGGPVLQVLRSTDLWDWEAPRGDGATSAALGRLPTWARSPAQDGAFWAPSVVPAEGRYVLYFAALSRAVPANRPGWCIGAARSDNPGGPYTPIDRPLVCRTTSHDRISGTSRSPAAGQGMIDPQAFRGPGGGLYLLVKALDRPWQLTSMRLRPDGLAVESRAHGLLELAAGARTWEFSDRLRFTVLENPAMDVDPTAAGAADRFQLFYSGNEWRSADYATGLASCGSPLGPCRRTTTAGPWLASSEGIAGPGGLSVAVGDDGDRWVAYHSWARGHVNDGNGRRLHVEPLGYRGGDPRLLQRSPEGTFTARSDLPGQVTFSGRARDPDTGRPVRVTIREEGVVVARATTIDGRYEVSIRDVELTTHRYCATVHDDHRAPDHLPPCQVVDLGI